MFSFMILAIRQIISSIRAVPVRPANAFHHLGVRARMIFLDNRGKGWNIRTELNGHKTPYHRLELPFYLTVNEILL